MTDLTGNELKYLIVRVKKDIKELEKTKTPAMGWCAIGAEQMKALETVLKKLQDMKKHWPAKDIIHKLRKEQGEKL